MKKNKITRWSYSHLFCIAFFLPFSTLLLAQESSDWAKPLKKAQDLLNNKEYKAALQAFETHAELGNGLAQFNVALFYDSGWGVDKQRATACVWYYKAAQSNMPGAMQQLGRCYQQGTGLEQDKNQALFWYKKAYEQGVHGAYCEAGMLLLENEHIPNNIEKGIRLCAKGAELGAINAQQKLAKWFFYGDYLAQDYQQAYKWLDHLANKKNPESAYLLALYYDRGIGVEVDVRQALKWYETAASQGFKDAYLPTAALYWREFTRNDNAELLAKSYLWTQAYCLVNNVKTQSSRRLKTQIMKVMPAAWQAMLNKQVKEHIQQFHSLNQSAGC